MRLVYLALGWCGGLFLAADGPLRALPPLFWLVLAALSALLAVHAPKALRWWLIALAALNLGALYFAGAAHSLTASSNLVFFHDDGGLTLEGRVSAEPDRRDDRVVFRLDVTQLEAQSRRYEVRGVALIHAPRVSALAYGDQVRVTGELRTPATFDTFSYADYLARQGVSSVMYRASVDLIAPGDAAFRGALIALRQRAQTFIAQGLPEPQAGLLKGILTGNERDIGPRLREAFQRVGASHIIAISGFNMVVVAGVVLRLTGGDQRRRGWPILAALSVMALYTLFVGADAAVVRAAIMTGVYLVGVSLRRRSFVPASLAVTALLMTLVDPYVLWDVSFQLSFAAVMGLALFADPLGQMLRALLRRMWPSMASSAARLLQEPLVVTLAAQITTAPLIVLYFERFSLVALPVNLLIVPVQAAVLIVGGLATLLAFVAWPLAQVVYWLVLLLLTWTIDVVRFFAALPFAEVVLRVDPRWIGLFFIVLTLGAIMQATRPRWMQSLTRSLRAQGLIVGLGASLMAALLLLLAVFFSRPDGHLHLHLLNVGHSNAVLIRSPGGAHILVDGGRYPARLLTALGERLPFYARRLDMLVITQPDPYDIAALPAVLRRYDVGLAIDNGQPNLSPEAEALREALADTPRHSLTAGTTLAFSDGLQIDVLHPSATPDLGDELSAATLVLRLRYGEVSLLLPGDLNAAGQRALLEAGQWPQASALQLPLHGRRRELDAAFLAAVQAQMAFVHAERGNPFGDPDADELAQLGEDVRLFRTDANDTALHLWTDGATIHIVERPH